jgi:hypothetical protein
LNHDRHVPVKLCMVPGDNDGNFCLLHIGFGVLGWLWMSTDSSLQRPRLSRPGRPPGHPNNQRLCFKSPSFSQANRCRIGMPTCKLYEEQTRG